MVKPILFYAEFSPAARSVLQIIKMLNLDVELRYFDYARKENVVEEFINPRHTVPTLIDDGEAFYDCHAIITYLVTKFSDNDRLYPAELVLRSKTDYRMYFNAGVLTPHLKNLIAPIIFNRAEHMSADLIQSTHRIYEQMETFLVRQYMVGNSITVADIVCSSSMFTMDLLVPVDPLLYPRIRIWLSLMAQLPDFEEVHAIGSKMLFKGLQKYMEMNVHTREELESDECIKMRKLRSKTRMLKHDADVHGLCNNVSSI